jgi:hypothetical protein
MIVDSAYRGSEIQPVVAWNPKSRSTWLTRPSTPNI